MATNERLLAMAQKNSTIGNNAPSVKRGNIQTLLKNAITEGKRKLGVIEANKRRGILHSQDRARLAELFKAEVLKSPSKSADAKVRRYYLAVLESWIDLKMVGDKQSSPYTLSCIRTRYERYHQRYDDLIGKRQRIDIDAQLKKTEDWLKYYDQNPEERRKVLKYIYALLDDPSILVPDALKKSFERIERGDVKQAGIFDRSENVEAKKEILI